MLARQGPARWLLLAKTQQPVTSISVPCCRWANPTPIWRYASTTTTTSTSGSNTGKDRGSYYGSAAPKSRTKKRLQRLLAASVFGAAVFAADHELNADALARTLRTAYYGALIAIDFKLNFNPEKGDKIDQLHERVAARIHHICVTNQGLYIKLAQSLAIQAAILPKPYREAFANIFDGAPSVPYEEVVRVFTKEFGVGPDEAFEEFDHKVLASASIAQVHRARLKRKPGQPPYKGDEGWVAVKVRKPSVPLQIEWDLFAYRTLLWTYEKLFDLPVAFVAEYVSEQMRKEVDLAHEASNATRAAENLANEPALRDKVSIPKVNWDWTGSSIMTADFVRGVKLTDRARIEEMGFSVKQPMDIATDLFAQQAFVAGFLHSDPHPGNILVRPHPKDRSRPEVVLIDHGLYIELPEDFRHDYCTLWRSLFVADTKTIEDIAQKWGIGKQNSDMFASMTLLRPHKIRKKASEHEGGAQSSQASSGNGESKQPSTYDAQAGLKDRLRSMLENEQLIPRELIFLTRGMRMMQSNNQTLGSPSNRINAMAHWAVKGLETSQAHLSKTEAVRTLGLQAFVRDKLQLVLFRLTLFVIDVGFLFTRARQWFLETFGRKADQGFEDVLQRQVTEMARNEFGIELDDTSFAG